VKFRSETRTEINVAKLARPDEIRYSRAMLIGYARVSTPDQSIDLQEDALRGAGCERIVTDVASGARAGRSGLAEALEYARKGDTLVVWKLDRLGRSLPHLIEVVTALEERGVGFKCLQESIDTTTPGGKLIFHLFGALAQFERDLIRERTNAGLAAARARGRHGGRPRRLTERQVALARAMLRDRAAKVADVCATLNVSRTTLYRALRTVAPPPQQVAMVG
jgi:DNA invertase Pin-like site-specific DNA recombinase